jgi:hypothetical protein
MAISVFNSHVLEYLRKLFGGRQLQLQSDAEPPLPKARRHGISRTSCGWPGGPRRPAAMRLTVLNSGTELGTTDQCLLEREEESNNISGAKKGRVGPRSMQLPL